MAAAHAPNRHGRRRSVATVLPACFLAPQRSRAVRARRIAWPARQAGRCEYVGAGSTAHTPPNRFLSRQWRPNFAPPLSFWSVGRATMAASTRTPNRNGRRSNPPDADTSVWAARADPPPNFAPGGRRRSGLFLRTQQWRLVHASRTITAGPAGQASFVPDFLGNAAMAAGLHGPNRDDRSQATRCQVVRADGALNQFLSSGGGRRALRSSTTTASSLGCCRSGGRSSPSA